MSNHDDGSSLFDGVEAVHSWERGESFGLERPTYARLGRCAMAVARKGVEPSTIAKLRSGPGRDLVLYGAQVAYTIRIQEGKIAGGEMAVTLYITSLDIEYTPLTPGHLIFNGVDCFRDWFRMTHKILMFENKEPQTLDEVSDAYEASEGIASPHQKGVQGILAQKRRGLASLPGACYFVL
jgi:hypothetical protein